MEGSVPLPATLLPFLCTSQYYSWVHGNCSAGTPARSPHTHTDLWRQTARNLLLWETTLTADAAHFLQVAAERSQCSNN